MRGQRMFLCALLIVAGACHPSNGEVKHAPKLHPGGKDPPIDSPLAPRDEKPVRSRDPLTHRQSRPPRAPAWPWEHAGRPGRSRRLD